MGDKKNCWAVLCRKSREKGRVFDGFFFLSKEGLKLPPIIRKGERGF